MEKPSALIPLIPSLYAAQLHEVLGHFNPETLPFDVNSEKSPLGSSHPLFSLPPRTSLASQTAIKHD